MYGRTLVVKHKCEFHIVACTVHVYQVIIYTFIQHSAHITVQKYFHSLATFRHVLVAANTIVREDNSMGQEHHYFKAVYLAIHTDIFAAPSTQSF